MCGRVRNCFWLHEIWVTLFYCQCNAAAVVCMGISFSGGIEINRTCLLLAPDADAVPGGGWGR